MATSASGTSGTGDAEDLINGPPLQFRPADEPEFIKRHRTTLLMVHTKVGSRIRRAISNSINPEDIKDDLAKLAVTYERAIQTNDTLSAAINLRDPASTSITKAERWKEDLQEEHQRLQDEVAAFIARMTHPAAANTSAADPVSTEAPSNTSQPMQTLSVPTSLQPSTSTLSHPGSPFRSAVNTNSTVTMRSPPSLSVTSAINSPRLALRPSLNPALNFNQQSSTVIRAANQPPSITHWIAQQQVAHQPLNQPSSFVQQLTAAAAGVMQQTPNQLPSVSQHQPPPPGIGQQQVAHQLLNHLSASVQQGASVNVMQQTPTQPLSVSQNPPPPSAAAVQQGASSFVMQQAPSQPPSVSQHQPPHSTMGQQQVAQQPLNLSVSSVQQGGSASVMQQVHNQLPSVSQNQPSSFGCLQQQLANQLLNQPAASGQQVSPAIMMQQSLNQVLSVAQHHPLPTSLAQQQGTFQPNTSSAPHGQQSVANVLMQPAPPVLNVAQYQPPSIGTAYPQVAHQLLNHSAASGYPAASSSSMQQPLNQIPNAAQYQPTSSGITQQQVTYQLPTSSAVHSQQSAVNVLLQQAQHQVSNAAQYQPTSSGSAQQQVTYQPFTSSAALVQQSAGNGLMQQAPHQVLNAAQYQPTFSGMSYSQSVHQPFSVAGPGHQMASGVTHQGPSVHLPVSSAAYAPPSWQSMQQLGSYQPPVTASVAGQQQCTVPQWPTSTATLQSSMYIPSGTVHQPGSIISSLYPATMYQQMAPIQAAPSSTGHQTIAHGLIHQPPYSHQTGAYQLPGSIPTSYHGQYPAASYFPPPCTSSSQSVNGAGLNISYPAQMIPQAGQQGWMPPIDQSARWGSSTARFSNIRVEPFDGDPLKWPMFISNFKTLIADELPTDALRLAALREHLTPSVRNVVADALHHPEMFNLAMHRLSEEFGESFVVSEAQVDKLLGLPTVKQNDQLSLKKFSSELHGAVAALVHSGNNVELSSSGTLKMLLMKLPQGLRTKWGTKVYEMLPRTPNIVDLDVWLRKMVKGYEYAAAALGSQPPPPPPPPPAAAHKLKKKTYTPTINAISDGATAGGENLEEEATGPETRRSSSEKGYACFCCKISPPHKIESCSTFLALTPTKRAELVRKENRCLRCVIGKHFSRRCPSRITCSVEGCDQRHHQLLHGAERVNPKPSATVEQQSSASGSINAVREEESVPGYVHRQIVSVVIRAPNGKKTSTLGFLDNGSSCVLIQQDLADELGLPGPTAERSFRLFNGEKVQVPSRLVDFMLCSKDGTTSFRVSMGYTTPKVEVAERITHWPEVKNRYPQLMDLDLPDVDPRNVKVLIGNNIFGAHVQLEVRYPDERAGGPGAIRTPFGWCVSGPVLSASVHHAESPYVNHIGLGDLMESVERFWITDSAGTNPPESLVLSKNDQRAIEIMESEMQLVDGHLQMGLLWKGERPHLKDSRPTALYRLQGQKRRFRRDSKYQADYIKGMADYVNRGFARLTTKEELENPPPWTAYIPHHGVYHPRKPDKLRIVFDMSAKSNGVSLNDCLLKGPDFLTSLLGVLLRFRTGFFSIVADIEKMFHQVHVRTEDQAAMRFLWRQPGDRAPPMTYQMTVFLFGSVCSPSVCSFALRKTATDSSAEYPGVVALVTDNFYVDNYLGSVNTTQEGKRIVKELTTVLKRGGFRLTGWFSSSREIMASVEKEERADSKWNHTFDPLPTDHALGVLYSSQEDAFLFKPVPRLEARTHRAVLSAIMSIFDPLGVLAPVVIDAKCILQEIVRRKLGMDDELPEDILRRWQSWNHKIKALEQFHLNRCFRSRPDVPVHQELHVCTDASEKAYGASAYLRLTFANGDVEVSFVMGKARVASLTQLSIPRLELEGAVLGHRLATTICEELRLPLKEVTFWTDSRTALCWIHGSRRYKAFVAHRVGEIRTTTGANQWRHIPGVMNPADHASRGVDPEDFTSDHTYITGPEFLRQNQEDHPAAVTIPEPNDDDPEVSTRQWVNSIAVSEPEPLSILFNRITWVPVCRCDRITRIVAWMRRFIYNVRAKRRREEKMSGPLTIQELGDAFTVCLKHAQAVCFPKEMKELEEGRPVPKSSQLLKLSPFLDPDGIIRVGGRLQKAIAAPDVKYPVVIPSTHRLAALIIWRFHVRGQLKGSHVSSERLLAELRSLYWIVGGRKTIQRVVRSCFTCRRQHAKAVAPKMAPLPVYRLEPRTFPFVNTGMDFCGPFYVVIGRSSQKRWVCLFTCMVTRATHLELTSGLDTETFMMAFQRFADLRGTPSVLLSDNGTNFVGARKELTEEAARLEDEAGVREELTKRRIEWRFNPPYSPHFGGIWERAVRTAKTTLKVVLGSRSVNEEVFRTVLGGVAALMNSRPLTHVSPSPDELEPLTPNHFLLGRANPHLPLITVNEKEVLSRRHFRAAQALLDCYWKRWTTEYLPTLNERKKWWSEQPEIRRNDFVLVMEPNTQRGQWNIGRIVESIPGQDQVKRVVRVRTAGKTYTRSVHNLVFLCRPEGLEEPQQPKAVSWPKKTVGRRSTKPQLESIQEE